MGIKYQVTVRAKNHDWYQTAKEFGSADEWEKWDSGKTPRYVREVGFRFPFNVNSIEKTENTTFSFTILNDSSTPMAKVLPNCRVITFNGDSKEGNVVLSESILDQIFIEKNSKNKTYVYCYIKESVEFIELTECVWLSPEHFAELANGSDSELSILKERVELIFSGGLLRMNPLDP